MSNSSLISYTNLHSKRYARTAKIDTITIHCTAGVTTQTAANICNYLCCTDYSCNYAVGGDGSIGLNTDEANISICSSSSANDNRAITIEVASNSSGTEVSGAAYNALIELVADICKRNGIAKLVWSTVKNERVNHLNGCNMTVHRDYVNKSCPGEYIYSRMGNIAAEVNALLGAAESGKNGVATEATASAGTYYHCQCGAFSSETSANALKSRLDALGFSGDVVKSGDIYRVYVGEYTTRSEADAQCAKIRAAGFSAFSAPYTVDVPTIKAVGLKKGDTGNVVKAAQLLLIANGISVGASGADGDFGTATRNGVIAFQSAKGLTQTEIFDEKTWRAAIGI